MAGWPLLTFLVLQFWLNFSYLECGIPRILRGRPRGGLLGIPAADDTAKLPPDQWVDQRLDHFNPADTRTWKQRYFVNDTFYKAGGPVFLMIGGEGTANPIWMVAGQWIKYAQYYNALCLMLEHRYYGKSHPTQDLSTENLAYLSSEQALEDLAYYRNAMVGKMNLSDAKWIAFGGSYPGSLATWIRLKYPHLIDGSVATSAPLFAKIDFFEYLGVVYESLDTTGPKCNPAIANATETIENMLGTDQGRKELKKIFRLCDDIDVNNKNDIANLFTNLAGNFEGVVQYNKDNRKFEGAIGTNVTINVLCNMMTNSSKGTAVQRYAYVNSLMLDTYGQKCMDFKYDSMIKDLQKINWASSAAEGGRQWMYQTCTEFGYYQTSDSAKQPFGQHFPKSFSVQQCSDIFGKKFNETFIQYACNRTNTKYGGTHPRISRIVFPNGSIDPWHALGITSDLSPDATAIYIKGTAHCANMYPDSPSDPPQLTQARVQIRKLIGQWIA